MTKLRSLHCLLVIACLVPLAACSSSSSNSNGAAGASNNANNNGGDGDDSPSGGDGDEGGNGIDGGGQGDGDPGDGDPGSNGDGDPGGNGDGDLDGGMSSGGDGDGTETTVENYTGVKTADCESAEPACELLCNMVCNNCGEHQGQMNGCGPAQGFAESAMGDGSSCGGCVDAIAAWAGTCESFSDVPAPVVMCEAPEPVELGPACTELSECCPRAEFPYDMGCQQVADSGDEAGCEAYLDIPSYCPPE